MFEQFFFQTYNIYRGAYLGVQSILRRHISALLDGMTMLVAIPTHMKEWTAGHSACRKIKLIADLLTFVESSRPVPVHCGIERRGR